MTDPALSREQALIQEIFAPLATRAKGADGLRDDAAVYTVPRGYETVLTVDTLIAGVHFLDEDVPADIARKALRVNLSDLAAKGARPRGYLLAIALTTVHGMDWVRAFAEGLREDQEHYACALFGGDITSTPGPLMVSITAFGEVPAGRAVRRSGGGPGDVLYVSGTIGDATLGLKALRGELDHLDEDAVSYLVGRYRCPEPRVELATALIADARSSIDISDGLVGDLGLMCWASGVSARVHVERVPLSRAARQAISKNGELLAACLTGGDDYEILCAVPVTAASGFETVVRATGVPFTRIGELVEGRGPPEFLGAGNRRMNFEKTSYSHL